MVPVAAVVMEVEDNFSIILALVGNVERRYDDDDDDNCGDGER